MTDKELNNVLEAVKTILKSGNDVEIKSCKDGFKILEVQRKRALTISNLKGIDTKNG